MTLDNIGFYTLSDARAKQASITSPLWRCELIITDKCNFSCPYCRGIENKNKGNISWENGEFIIKMWGSHQLKNIRFSGGEPTLWTGRDLNNQKKNLIDLVQLAKEEGVERIAVSTNGSNNTDFYHKLISAGVNDFSISLDANCPEIGDLMAGNKAGMWYKVVDNIRILSKESYVTLGVVFTPDNISNFEKIVEFGDSLGVSDIRIISSAQWNKELFDVSIDQKCLDRHPILKYRVNHFNGCRHVRGLQITDSHKCHLMMDDMAILNGYHYPCVIYMREQGEPIGKVNYSLSHNDAIKQIRNERMEWIRRTDTHCDTICKHNCLDVCIDYNNTVTTNE